MFVGHGEPFHAPCDFFDVCTYVHAVPAVHSLSYFARYISPLNRSRRFDTTYFVWVTEEDLEVTLDMTECTEYCWGTPQQFLHQYQAGHIQLFPPQVYLLSLIQHLGTVARVLTHGQQHVPLLAQPVGQDLCYPGDSRHNFITSAAQHWLRFDPVELRLDEEVRKCL